MPLSGLTVIVSVSVPAEDGVKVIEDDGWALVLPDPEEPLTHVWAEAPSASQAEARVGEYVTRLQHLLQ